MKFDALGSAVMTPLWAGRKRTLVRVDADDLRVQMSWAFRCTVPRSAIVGITRPSGSVLSRGAHGWRGRWLVNGAGTGLVTITIDPPARGRVTGVPVRVRELTLSLDDPDGFIAALA